MSVLTGRRVVVTAPAGSDLGQLLTARGAEVIECPTIAIADPESWEQLETAARRLEAGEFDWVLFTSRNTVTRALPFLERGLGRAKVGAVGDKTAELLTAHSIAVDLVPPGGTGRDLVEALGAHRGRVLVPRAAGAPRGAMEALETRGWAVVDPPAYRTVVGTPDAAEVKRVRAERFDGVTFTSGSTARNFVRLVGSPDSVHLGVGQRGPIVACIGPETEAVAREEGLRVDLVAEPHTNEGLVDALAGRLGVPGVAR